MNTFANWSDLTKKLGGYKIYIELSNGYYISVNKSDLKKVANGMQKNGDKFCGNIIMGAEGHKYAQIKIVK